MPVAVFRHLPEYLMEAGLLGCFMVSACTFATLLQHPDSPLTRIIRTPLLRRAMMGTAMGLTAVALIYSPWGQRSGAHMNPATTLTYGLRGKIEAVDVLFYIAFQFAGASAGVGVGRLLLRGRSGHASVNHVVTAPGFHGVGIAWIAELLIAFGMMFVILAASNDADLSPYTGVFAGMLVALYITFESPLSGMSLNPARSFGSAFVARQWRAIWVYLTAPVAGMLLALAAHAWAPGDNHVYCAKLSHGGGSQCIFHCEYEQLRARRQASRIRDSGG